jgi:hypothetical protein
MIRIAGIAGHCMLMVIPAAFAACPAALQAHVLLATDLQQTSGGQAANVAPSSVGKVGERQSRDAAKSTKPLTRVMNRVQNRIQSRIRSRIDRTYLPTTGPASSYAAAEEESKAERRGP